MRYKFVRSPDAETYRQTTGESNVFLATGADTDGRVSIYDSRLKVGNGAPWHYHQIDDEIFYIVSGRVEFGVADEVLVALPGDLVIAGPQVPRRFRALEDSHMLVVNAPGGPSERFLRDVMTLEQPVSEADRERFANEYGIHVIV